MSKKINWKKIHPLSAIVLISLLGWGIWSFLQPASYGVCLQGFNYTDRSIAKYSVNGEWGGGLPPKPSDSKFGGGGGFACGPSVAGPEVKIKWI
ncbi:hypothetical protein, partial [Iodobacter sp.]|uniref:hypothetical protein n=1 Tax=Iodobacter sp. TaxID=1915058 RepID=UPI0025EFA668